MEALPYRRHVLAGFLVFLPEAILILRTAGAAMPPQLSEFSAILKVRTLVATHGSAMTKEGKSTLLPFCEERIKVR